MNDRPMHPRPQLVREGRESLDGDWEFAFDRDARWREPGEPVFERQIRVPFAPETPLSGIAEESYTRACWYRRRVPSPPLAAGERLRLHFGAVDWSASVFVNGRLVAQHEGGYTPFEADVTAFARAGSALEIVVRAEDDPLDLTQPRGKQDWKPEPHAIWYPRTTGIWQSVWWERVPETYIERLRWTPDVERFEVGLALRVAGTRRDGLRLRVRLRAGERVLADDVWSIAQSEVERRIAIPDPGLDGERGLLLWHPLFPICFDAELALLDTHGCVLDVVTSYTALRSVKLDGDRLLVNGHPEKLRLVLDQGYWPESGMTPPSAEALRRDVELTKAMGFTGVRKRRRSRILASCARRSARPVRLRRAAERLPIHVGRRRAIGARVDARDRARREPSLDHRVGADERIVGRARSHGQRRTAPSAACALFLTRTLDPTRPVICNDGWEMSDTDFVGIHDYDTDASSLARRYEARDGVEALLARERPGTKRLLLDEPGYRGNRCCCQNSAASPTRRMRRAAGAMRAPKARRRWRSGWSGCSRRYTPARISGFCWTQLTDTYQEANGLLFADRTPKIPLDRIRRAVCGG